MNQRIQKTLQKKFEKHRIVFWYDSEQELRKDFEELELDGVVKLEVANNEFGLKHLMLRENPIQKYLVYKEGNQPPDLSNWLLDVQLAQDEFRTDQAAIWLAELELGYEFTSVVREHSAFFNSKKRRESLKRLVSPDDTHGRIRLKMLAVCAASDPRLDSILENLLAEHSLGRTDRVAEIKRANLEDFLWEQANKTYGYSSETPGVHDFVIELFKSCYAMGTDGEIRLNSEALVFLKRWKDSRQHEVAFEDLSAKCAVILNVEDDLQHCDYRHIIELDYFELIDRKILSDLVSQVRNRTLSAGECTQYIRSRRSGHWFSRFADLYNAVDLASQFFHALDGAKIECESIKQGLEAYTQNFFKIDQLYRKFILNYRRSRQVTLLEELANEVRNHYTNTYLRQLCNHWQTCVNNLREWSLSGTIPQSQFFSRIVDRFLSKNNKIYVIISDALRYEVADELAGVIRQEDRFDADLKYMVSGLPSYTQLGMASLLPHEKRQINADKSATVNVDGSSSQGTANRSALLNAAISGGKGLAIQAEEILNKNTESCRELVRDYDVIYVYQNRIDKTGHSRDTEKDVFIAVEEAIEEIAKLVKKLTSANASNILITADHGFLYQDEVVEESDFSVAEPEGEVLFTDRRFILGRNLKEVDGVKKYTPAQLGLEGDIEVLIPNSINRFRKRGSSTRFVHGGSTLQEIVVPVIEVNKKRATTISIVDVDLIPSSTSVISSGQLAVAFYQTAPVTDKLQARKLRVGLYSSTGELISDSHELSFDLTSENPRERELKIRLLLSKRADEFNKQQVTLRLQEPVAGTSHYTDYIAIAYTLRRSFTSEFDFE